MTAPLPTQPRPGSPKADWACWAADIGRNTGALKVFQCRPDGSKDHTGKSTAKMPRFKGWQASASWDRKTVEAEWSNYPDSNIGLLIQPGFVAIDADVYKPGNEKLLAEFEKEHGRLPDTLEFKSASGGYHLIYSTTRDLGNGTGNLPKFGDVRGGGKGFLVGPGSTVNGNIYAVEHLAPVVPLPASVDACLVTARVLPAGSRELIEPPPFVMVDDPNNQMLYATWLKTVARPSIEGHGGNNDLAAAGAMGSSYGLSADVVVDLLIEHFNPRCDPEWSVDDIARYGGSGYRSHTSAFGNMAQRNTKLMFEPQLGQVGFGPELDSMKSLMAMEDTPREWAWGTDKEGWMPLAKLTTLYGPDGSGKTTLVGQMALAFARGDTLFGQPTVQMPVLFIAGEDDRKELRRRFGKQGARGSDPIRLASWEGEDCAMHPPTRRGQPFSTPGDDTMFWQFLDYHLGRMGEGPKLLVLDNLGQVYQGDYMDTAEVRSFINYRVIRLLNRHNATGLLLAHPSESQKTNGDGSFGSQAWSSAVRSRIYFDWMRDNKGKQTSDTRILSRKKASYSIKQKQGEGVFLNWHNWSFIETEAPEVEEPASGGVDSNMKTLFRKAVIETVMNLRGGGYSNRELARELNKRQDLKATPVETLRKWLNKLADDSSDPANKLYHNTRQTHLGKWHCTDKQREEFQTPAENAEEKARKKALEKEAAERQKADADRAEKIRSEKKATVEAAREFMEAKRTLDLRIKVDHLERGVPVPDSIDEWQAARTEFLARTPAEASGAADDNASVEGDEPSPDVRAARRAARQAALDAHTPTAGSAD